MAKNFGSALLQTARGDCVSLSAFFIDFGANEVCAFEAFNLLLLLLLLLSSIFFE